MPKLTALIRTSNDAVRIGRALESLRPCDEFLIIDDGSNDETARVAREYGARVELALAEPLEQHRLNYTLSTYGETGSEVTRRSSST